MINMHFRFCQPLNQRVAPCVPLYMPYVASSGDDGDDFCSDNVLGVSPEIRHARSSRPRQVHLDAALGQILLQPAQGQLVHFGSPIQSLDPVYDLR